MVDQLEDFDVSLIKFRREVGDVDASLIKFCREVGEICESFRELQSRGYRAFLPGSCRLAVADVACNAHVRWPVGHVVSVGHDICVFFLGR